jgi:hypothetical protein
MSYRNQIGGNLENNLKDIKNAMFHYQEPQQIDIDVVAPVRMLPRIASLVQVPNPEPKSYNNSFNVTEAEVDENYTLYSRKYPNCIILYNMVYTKEKTDKLNSSLIKKLKEKELETSLYRGEGTIIRTEYQSRYPTEEIPSFSFTNVAYINSLRQIIGPFTLYNIIFSQEYYVKDPFFEILLKNVTDNTIYDWYHSFNPEFRPMREITRHMVEYKTLIAGMIKDLIYSLIFNVKPNNDIKYATFPIIRLNHIIKENIELLLQQIESIIPTFQYSDIINIIKSYMILFETDQMKANQYACDKEYQIFDILLDSPYMIFPSFYMLNYDKVVLTLKIPLINYYITKYEHKIHDMDAGVCTEIFHDIRGHYYIMNLRSLELLLDPPDPFYYDLETMPNYLESISAFSNWERIIRKINTADNLQYVKEYFSFINKIITIFNIEYYKNRPDFDFNLDIPADIYNTMIDIYIEQDGFMLMYEDRQKYDMITTKRTEPYNIHYNYNIFLRYILFYYMHESFKLYNPRLKNHNIKGMFNYMMNFYNNITDSIPTVLSGSNYIKFLNQIFKLDIPIPYNITDLSPEQKEKIRELMININNNVSIVLGKLQEKIREQFKNKLYFIKDGIEQYYPPNIMERIRHAYAKNTPIQFIINKGDKTFIHKIHFTQKLEPDNTKLYISYL